MKPKFDINNFELLNNKQIILECEFCGKEFTSTKKYVRRVLSGNTRNALRVSASWKVHGMKARNPL